MTALENGPGSALPAPEDLHDHVIQDLFTLGLRIQGDAARSEPAVAEQINGYAETLDEVIATIRTSVVGLRRRFNLFRQAGVGPNETNRVQLQFGGAGKARTNLGLHTATSIVMTIFADRIPHAFELSGQGTIKSVARPVFRRKKAAEAHRAISGRHTAGKVVLIT